MYPDRGLDRADGRSQNSQASPFRNSKEGEAVVWVLGGWKGDGGAVDEVTDRG